MGSSQQNANNNHIGNRLQTHHCDTTPHIEADIVMANILANPLITLAQTLALHTKSGGMCVLSGILADQVALVSGHYKKHFKALEVRKQDGWACLVLCKT